MQSLIDKLRAKRQAWIELDQGLKVLVRRPPECEFTKLVNGLDTQDAAGYVVGWDGMTEAVLLGPAIGSSDPIPFDKDLWLEASQDRAEWIASVAAEVVRQVSEHLEAKRGAQKN